MTDAMHWTPDLPADDRPEPLLRIDLTGHADDPVAARAHVEQAVADWCRDNRLDTP